MDSPDHPTSNLSLLTEDPYNNFSPEPDLYDLPIDQPPLSAFPSESTSVLASDSDLPPLSAFPSESNSALASDSDLPLPFSAKAKKQTGLFDFFPKIPSEESHARWRKRKRDNEEKDREAYAKQQRKEEAEKSLKKAHRRESNKESQRRRRDRLRKENVKAKLQGDSGQESSVSFL